jgi:hypothetical protein
MAADFLKTREPAVQGQQGDKWTYKTVAEVKDIGVPRERMLEVLGPWNEKCSPPWDVSDLEGKVERVFQYGRSTPGSKSFEERVKAFELVPPEESQQPPQDGPSEGKPKFTPKPRSARYLKNTEFKAIMFTIDNLLPEGAFLLVAAPKIGKSWLTLQMALAVATGGEVLGFKAKQGKALVLALEDSDRRLKKRLGKLGFDDLPDEALDRLQFVTEWPQIGKGGLEALEKWVDENPDTRLIVVDVLECIRPETNSKDNAYTQDYRAVKALQELAGRHGITVVIVHHTRKQKADDSMQRVSGTNGLAGAADGVLILDRERQEEDGKLEVLARDLEHDAAYAVRFRGGQWTMVGPAGQVAKTALQTEILTALRASDTPMKQTQIARVVGRAQSTISQALQVMVREKSVVPSMEGYTAASSGNEFEPVGDAAFEGGQGGGTPAT